MKNSKIKPLYKLFLKTIDKTIHLSKSNKKDSTTIKTNLTHALYLNLIHRLEKNQNLQPLLKPINNSTLPSKKKFNKITQRLKAKLQKNPQVLETAFKKSSSVILHSFVSKLKPQLSSQTIKQLKQDIQQNFS